MTRCPQCGANIKGGTSCGYCGALLMGDALAVTESARLDQLHTALAAAVDEEARCALISSGFVPSHPRALIDAGYRCSALLVTHGAYMDEQIALRKRVAVIVSRLRTLPSSRELQKVIDELSRTSTEHADTAARNGARDGLMGCAILLVALVACSVVALIVWR